MRIARSRPLLIRRRTVRALTAHRTTNLAIVQHGRSVPGRSACARVATRLDDPVDLSREGEKPSFGRRAPRPFGAGIFVAMQACPLRTSLAGPTRALGESQMMLMGPDAGVELNRCAHIFYAHRFGKVLAGDTFNSIGTGRRLPRVSVASPRQQRRRIGVLAVRTFATCGRRPRCSISESGLAPDRRAPQARQRGCPKTPAEIAPRK
jgi:hypothetical protein